MGLCLWSSQPGLLNESSALTILVHSVLTARHPIGSGYKRGHSNISSGYLSHLENPTLSSCYLLLTCKKRPTLAGKARKEGPLGQEMEKKPHHFSFFFGMDYVWPSLKCEWPVCPIVWSKGCHGNNFFSVSLCLLFSTGFRTNHGVWPGQETKQFSPCTPSTLPLRTPQQQHTNLPSTIPILPSWN